MKTKLNKFLFAGLALAAALPLKAQAGIATAPPAYNDADLNAALGIPDSWIWLQNDIVPLAMLVVFLGVVIIMAELQYRQHKILDERLRGTAEMSRQNLESN